jgi:hypothetical protein
MAVLFTEGFDKYGGINSNVAAVVALLTAGEWTTTAGTVWQIVAGLSGTGYAAQIGSNSSITKTLALSYGRLIGGIRFQSTLAATSGISFQDAGTAQAGITINTNGTISARNGGFAAGTVLATSTASISANTTHYLEWDFTFGNTGSYQVWLDGVSILGPTTADTTTTANNTSNGVLLGSSLNGTLTLDDLYFFDSSGTTNNAASLTSPRIETQFPTADAAVQFSIGAAILGTNTSRGGSNINTAANQLRLRAFTPSRAMTLNSISFLPAATNATINLRPVVYADTAGVPGALLGTGSTLVGMTSGTPVVLPLTTPQNLTAGTQYWCGMMCDIAVTTGLTGLESATTDRTATSTFSSGAPGTAPAMTAAAGTIIWGNVTGTGANYYEVSQNPAAGANSYVYDATVGHEDLYSFPPLSTLPSNIYAVAVKGNLSKSDAGAKTVSLRTKSGATDSAGTNTSIAPGTSFAWASSFFERDPNGNVAWTKTALDAAQSGVKVET